MQEAGAQHKLVQELQEMKERLAELGQRRFGAAWERMRKNENRYRSLFEDASVGLWEEDWSLIREYLQSLRDSGVADLKGYFERHPASVVTCLELVRVLEVNRAALYLCGIDHKRRFCPASSGGEASGKLFEGILKVFEGAQRFSCEVNMELSTGGPRHLLLRIEVPQESRPSLERVFLSVTDVMDLKRTEEKLRRRLKFEEMVQRISMRFLFGEDLDRAIEESLAEVGLFVGASRSYVFLFDAGMTRMDNTHEWCDREVSPQKDNLQGLSLEGRSWWMNQLGGTREILIEDMDLLPLDAAQEQKDLKEQDIRSLVVTAFSVGTRSLGGFVGFDSVSGDGSWGREDVAILRTLADLIGNALGRRETARILKAREERFTSLFNSVGDALYLFPLDRESQMSNFCEVNDVACARLGYSRSELLGMSPMDVITPEQHKDFLKWQEILMREGTLHVESVHRNRQGKEIPVEINSNLVLFEGQEYVITISRDITDRREAEQRMEYMASHDHLTDLLNRKTMDRLLDWESEKCRRQNLPLGLLLVDIDDLDSVNLAYGNAVGDEVIREVANVLREEAGEGVLAGRYGGDCFLLLIPGQRVEQNGLSERISGALKRRNDACRDTELSLSVSQGTANWEPLRGLPVSAAFLEAAGRLNELKRASREKDGFLQERLHWGGN